YYAAQQWADAQRTLRQAIQYDSTLLQQTDSWRHSMATQALSYRVAEPIQFIENIFAHLPEEAYPLRACQEVLLGHVHTHLALYDYYTGEIAAAQQHLLEALTLKPALRHESHTFAVTLSHTTFHLPVTDFHVYIDRVLAHL